MSKDNKYKFEAGSEVRVISRPLFRGKNHPNGLDADKVIGQVFKVSRIRSDFDEGHERHYELVGYRYWIEEECLEAADIISDDAVARLFGIVTTRDLILRVLTEHVGTAGEFCKACPDWIPDEDARNTQTEREYIRAHQADQIMKILGE